MFIKSLMVPIITSAKGEGDVTAAVALIVSKTT